MTPKKFGAGLGVLGAGFVLGYCIVPQYAKVPSTFDKPSCAPVEVDVRGKEYIAMDWGYGEWVTFDENGNATYYGYAMEEDGLVYSSVECALMAPTYEEDR